MLYIADEDSLKKYDKAVKAGKKLTKEDEFLILYGTKHPETMGTKDGKPRHSISKNSECSDKE